MSAPAQRSARRVRVLLVDDSPVVRARLEQELRAWPDVEVVGAAPDAFAAREMLERLAPDVLVLDIELPRMDGLTFLKKVMHESPLPVIVLSAVTPAGCALALACLEAGAVAVLSKPSGGKPIAEVSSELADLIRAARGARVRAQASAASRTPASVPAEARAAASPRTRIPSSPGRLVAIGASAGGTEALRKLLATLPEESPAVAVVQHMPEGFTRLFAEQLDRQCRVRVREAVDGAPLEPGSVSIAPGDRHLQVWRSARGLVAKVGAGPRVKRHRPSVEVLFESAAIACGADVLAVLLTGMGDDGADGMGSVRRAGGLTIAQDEASCVVFGMPARAIERGHVDDVLPLDRIPGAIVDWALGRRRPARDAS